ncbi:hypothetical protein [Leptolyngbya sp. 7M]|uniref:hypothetical protein n=1 Tax=Leptolyngbya sp. 7M TaxID=2812896 RepID=UPI001B8CDD9C|nr:hypothetical protein [Leptolyngbya sp. 7M]QYO66421.1 hypothetical protein JVX88_06370 [Leptolyngbya sp. 7M]
MLKLKTLFFATVMMLSLVFIGGSISSSDTSMQANAAQTRVKRKRRPGAIRTVARGTKRVGRATYRGGRWVTRRVYRGGRWVTVRTWQGGRKVVSRSKKIIY